MSVKRRVNPRRTSARSGRAAVSSPAIKKEHSPRRQSLRTRKSTRAAPKSNTRPVGSPEQTSREQRPGSTVATTSSNQRRLRPLVSSYASRCSVGPEHEQRPSLSWDCVSYVVSDQKIHTTYEKPIFCLPSVSYGKMTTKTVTVTVTTTIATTEVFQPGEDGYEESVQRQNAQAEASPEAREEVERLYQESRIRSEGNKEEHDEFHQGHHRSAQPTPPVKPPS